MDKPNHIFIPAKLPDFSLPLPKLRAPHGKLIVAIPKAPAMSGSLHLPESVQGRLRPDCGIVVHAGTGIAEDIKDGDIVLVRPYDGIWVEDEDWGYQIRIYGQERNLDGDFVAAAVADSIICRWCEPRGEWLPVGTNVFVKPPDDWIAEDEPGPNGLLLLRSGEPESGTVLSSGLLVRANPGTAVYFKSEGPEDILYFNVNNKVDRSKIVVPANLIYSASELLVTK